jgi:F0F1-type ATP synthase membrane subunit b/b'
MAEKSLEERVNMLERGVEILEQLPDRVTALEVQIVELRGEMRAEFSATRAEAREGDERVIQTLREEIRAGDERVIQTLREEIRAGDEHVVQTLRQEIHAGDEHVVQTLRREIRAGDEETRRFMRILHEDLVERIEILGGKR